MRKHQLKRALVPSLFAFASLAAPLAAAQETISPPVVQSNPVPDNYVDRATGRATGELSTSRTVRTDDLNLNTPQGQQELDRRIQSDALAECEQLNESATTKLGSERGCVRDAERNAHQQESAH